MIIAAEVCGLPTTGISPSVVIAGFLVLLLGIATLRWVRQSMNRLSLVIAPLLLLGGLASVPKTSDCIESNTATPAATTTTVAATTTITATTIAVTAASTTTTAAATTTSSTTTVAATTTTVAATTTTTIAPYSRGTTGPGGGEIFFVDLDAPDGQKYYEVACNGWQNSCDGTNDPEVTWGCSGTNVVGTSAAIGSGPANTEKILLACGTSNIAARVVDNYTKNGHTDWFLPSQGELNAFCKWVHSDNVNTICNNSGAGAFPNILPGRIVINSYWSSTQKDATSAYNQYFQQGAQYDYGKANVNFVRPFRRF